MMMTTMFSGLVVSIYLLYLGTDRQAVLVAVYVGWKYKGGIYTCGKEHNRNGHKNYYAN